MSEPLRRVLAFSIGLGLLTLGGLLLAPSANAAEEGEGSGEEAQVANVLYRITTVEDGVEIEVRSTRQFPTRALSPVLRIGDREFDASRHPEDGREDTLIFWVPAEEFEALSNEDAVSVYYGRRHPAEGETVEQAAAAAAAPARMFWSFGKLRKELLDGAPETPQEE